MQEGAFSRFAGMLRAGLDFVLPPSCHLCGKEILSGGLFCAECFGSLRRIIRPFCLRCAEPFATEALGGAHRLCLSCETAPPVWRQARAVFVYDEWSRRLILPLKYADRTENARLLATMMASAGADLLENSPVIVPVPLHRSRLRRRRYNQAALLARSLARKSGARCLVRALCRQRPTASLARLSRAERQEQLKDAIVVRSCYGRALSGQRVVLIDDVLTTGATASACAGALLAAGCSSVDVLVAARAPVAAGSAPF